MSKQPTISIVVPLYNEESGAEKFHRSLIKATSNTPYAYEIIYCNDGSTDSTASVIMSIANNNPLVKLVSLSRNFGKEAALSAGLAQATGNAVITLDGDGQHPVELIDTFLKTWQAGAQVVVGVRKKSTSDTATKRIGSRLFYSLFNRISTQKLTPGSTDFRLLDREVVDAFLRLKESDRMTRGLIDWLGFTRVEIPFTAKERTAGNPEYSTKKLTNLALHTITMLSLKPLFFVGWAGVVVTLLSTIVGLAVFIEQLILGDPLKWKFTGTAMLAILLVFLVGIILMSLGVLSAYIASIHTESRKRPLYIINKKDSKL